MTTSLNSQSSRNSPSLPTGPQRISRPQIATLIMLGVVALSGAIVAAWFAGQGTISRIFYRLNELQETPPLWLKVPMVAGEYLLFPTVALFLIVLLVMRVSPQPRAWSRFVMVGILLALTLRYLLWRSLSTLNLNTPLDGVFSIGLFLLELLMLTSSTIQLFLMLRVRDRRREADWLAMDVEEGRYMPTVDVLIPTYNEPTFILRRTVIGCQAMDYPRKRVYLLDDTRRPEVKALADELGCEYLSRPDNRYAKAGNLNHAIKQTSSELIVVFDADFVPTTNFLTRTLGFFQDPQVALVQTPQSFYNPDPIARNLGLENVLTPEEEVFYRQIQLIRDGAGSVICSGTSFVVRRTALEAAGGFVTDSLSEDYFTGIRLSAQGYRLVYLNEKLSAGLAAENMAAHAVQRLRWAQGTLQAFFIKANPLTIRGLNPLQRLAHLEGLLHWFTSISRVGFLLMPLAYSFLGVIPLRATPAELLYFFLPYYLVQLSVFSWLNYRSRSALLSDIYSLVLCIPLAITVVRVMLNPFAKGFRVTPKGAASHRFSFNWDLAWPLLILFVATAISLWVNFGLCMLQGAWVETVSPEDALRAKGIGLGWIWSSYNLIMIGIALLILLDVPRPCPYEWFDLRRTVQVNLLPRSTALEAEIPQDNNLEQGLRHPGSVLPRPLAVTAPGSLATMARPIPSQTFWGITTMISEIGVEVALTQSGFPTVEPGDALPVQLEILEDNIFLTGNAVRTGMNGEFPTVRILFESISLQQQRQLVELLFCRPGQWKSRCTPGEIQSLLLLFRILLRPRVLFDRNVDVSAVSVAQV
ncbi:MAG: glycosyltransferase [Synechococcales cyanobacterium C42_A2020_086]|jgi:cellulose synthase (UDP-forming)|nr:glycosyltransferase [Synechococcales cyanobacterium C42_A2020_086]